MNLASLCTREVIGIPATATLREAAALMCEEHVGSLVVLTSDEPPKAVGIVTDRDLALEAVGRAAPASPPLVGHLVRGRPLGVPGSVGVREAAAAMEEGGVRRLLVLDEEGWVIGIVSVDDLLREIAGDLAALAGSLRKGIAREASERHVARGASRPRALYPDFGMAAMQ